MMTIMIAKEGMKYKTQQMKERGRESFEVDFFCLEKSQILGFSLEEQRDQG